MPRTTKSLTALVIALSFVGCAPSAFAPRPTARPTLTAIRVYMNETSGYYESLAAATVLIKARIDEEQKNPSLFDDKTWQRDVAGALRRIRDDFATVAHAPPPQGAEEYHQAMIQAEANTNAAAQSLQAWLDSRDEVKLKQALQQLAASDAGLERAQKLLNSLLETK